MASLQHLSPAFHTDCFDDENSRKRKYAYYHRFQSADRNFVMKLDDFFPHNIDLLNLEFFIKDAWVTFTHTRTFTVCTFFHLFVYSFILFDNKQLFRFNSIVQCMILSIILRYRMKKRVPINMAFCLKKKIKKNRRKNKRKRK